MRCWSSVVRLDACASAGCLTSSQDVSDSPGFMSEPASQVPGRILVVDDNQTNRALIGGLLKARGHEVATAENGLVALERLHEEVFDLVVLDVMMPELDGFQVLERLHAEGLLQMVPVIMSTALDELDSVVRCIELGAEDYLVKPVNPVLLNARVGASLEKKRLRDSMKGMIRQFASSEVADSLLSEGFQLGGKLVEATVMFSDIRGFTPLVESQAPADVIELLNTYYALMFEAISAEGGVVNQMLGDGIMAIFGAPVATETRRADAVRAARKMLDLLDVFNADRARAGRDPIRIGIGISTGPVIAGFTGTLERASYTCVGNTVNLAARLEEATKHLGRTILIDEPTRSGLPDDLPVDDLGALDVRGRSHPIRIYAAGGG